ncbi:Hypothetical protein GLP15_1809 [Giardia lamblia P15]|uniref:Uncharacterized protein n=1 Tax=Giardia intestinalis (strain P15) TaxID=658858 RepID=E1EW63_GIAIA|nr:Hypothetical protein GLP15_1809 [Giardia lamblia P15]
MNLSLSSLYTDDNILQNIHKLIHECTDVTTQYDLRQEKLSKEARNAPQSPQLLSSPRSPNRIIPKKTLEYEPIRHLEILPIDTFDAMSQCYVSTKSNEIQCTVSTAFSYVQTEEYCSSQVNAHRRQDKGSTSQSPTDDHAATFLATKLDACTHTLAKKTEKYAQLKERFAEAKKLNEELMKEYTAAEQRALEYKKEAEMLSQYKEGVEQKLLPSLKELQCTNDVLTDNLRIAIQDKERLTLEVEQKDIIAVRLQEDLQRAHEQISTIMQLHPQIVLAEKATCSSEDNIVCTNTRGLITDLDASNSCIGLKKELLSKGTAIDDIHSQSSVNERTKGSQTRQRKLRDCDQQYDIRDTDGLICPPLALKSKDMCSQTCPVVLTAEEEAVQKNGGSIECDKCTKLNRRIVELEARAGSLLRDLKLTEEERDKADCELTVLEKKCSERKARCTALDKEIKSLKETLKEQQDHVKATDEALEKCKADATRLTGELNIRDAELLKLAEACTTLEKERDNAYRAQTAMQYKLDSLKRVIQEIKD